jgi:hypothetical protein
MASSPTAPGISEGQRSPASAHGLSDGQRSPCSNSGNNEGKRRRRRRPVGGASVPACGSLPARRLPAQAISSSSSAPSSPHGLRRPLLLPLSPYNVVSFSRTRCQPSVGGRRYPPASAYRGSGEKGEGQARLQRAPSGRALLAIELAAVVKDWAAALHPMREGAG